MASTLRFTISLAISTILSLLCISNANAIDETFTPPPSLQAPPQQVQDHPALFSHTALLPPILAHLGFNELAVASRSLSDSPVNAWTGPSTLFAPSDSSLRLCLSCSISELLREHIVPGLFTMDYLRKLDFGSKIETLVPGRCVTVTSESLNNNTVASKIFIGGAEITHPELFNNGVLVIHGLSGHVSPLSPFSCDTDRMNSLSFPLHLDRTHTPHQTSVQLTIMRMMLRDTMLRLRNSGFSILTLAMRLKYAELVNLNNMTVFAVDDASIFSGSHSYVSNVRFHIVQNQLLTYADLEKLPAGMALPSLERGQYLIVTTGGGGASVAPIRINYVRIKIPDVIRNLKIVVHSLFLPFPHINPTASVYNGILGGETSDLTDNVVPPQTVHQGTCKTNQDGNGGCGIAPMPQASKQSGEIEDHHGL